ncbi:DUF563 domain-containing protein [Paenibacillus chartarius]|uniref:DUF563 domain-containing protein n=1 Tax=Paenibacillus chartarius TaxID=747481 RepID=A0ABV6DMN8_9BACL
MSRPLGYCTVQEWVHSSRSKYPENMTMDLNLAAHCRLSPSKGLYQPVFTEMAYREPNPFVSIVAEGRVWGRSGAVLTPNVHLLYDASTYHDFDPRQHEVFHAWTPLQMDRFHGTAAVITCWDPQNYFHWLYDIIARFELLRKSGVRVDQYILNGTKHRFLDEVLRLLKIEESKVVYTDDQFYWSASQLAIPSLPNRVGYSEWTVDFLRKKLLPYASKDFRRSKSIYISRGDAAYRRIANEHEVIGVLQRFGFEVYTLGALTLKEQIQLFASAEMIVAPHGAGLANLTFAQPGTKVIELFAETFVSPLYWVLSHHCKLDYYTLVSKAYNPQGYAGFHDSLVDINELCCLLLKIRMQP